MVNKSSSVSNNEKFRGSSNLSCHLANRRVVVASIVLWMPWTLLVSFLSPRNCASAFVPHGQTSARRRHQCQSDTLGTTPENDALYNDMHDKIRSIAGELWEGSEIPCLSSAAANRDAPTHHIEQEQSPATVFLEGEAQLSGQVPVSERASFFRDRALAGCPRAQHSYGLLLWSGFADTPRDPRDSARFHAAAACQHHLDGMAVLGGCFRTGTGLPKTNDPERVALGLKLIDFCASTGNPTGVNKQAALLESNGDDFRAVALYEACRKRGRANALLLFNLGWCWVNGRGVDKKDRDRGIRLWKEAAGLAPDEGSEEAAWNLYQEYHRDDPREARVWQNLAHELGYDD